MRFLNYFDLKMWMKNMGLTAQIDCVFSPTFIYEQQHMWCTQVSITRIHKRVSKHRAAGIKLVNIWKEQFSSRYWNKIYRVTLCLKKCGRAVSASGLMRMSYAFAVTLLAVHGTHGYHFSVAVMSFKYNLIAFEDLSRRGLGAYPTCHRNRGSRQDWSGSLCNCLDLR